MRNVVLLHKLGYTGKDVVLAHCIWPVLMRKRTILAAYRHSRGALSFIQYQDGLGYRAHSGIADFGGRLWPWAWTARTTTWMPLWKYARRPFCKRRACTNPRLCPPWRRWSWPLWAGRRPWGRRTILGSLEVGKESRPGGAGYGHAPYVARLGAGPGTARGIRGHAGKRGAHDDSTGCLYTGIGSF